MKRFFRRGKGGTRNLNKFLNKVQTHGTYSYNDAATATTPISITAGNSTYLTNDGAGDKTYSFPINGVVDLWDTENNEFDFSSLSHGDAMLVQAKIEVTTAANNQTVTMQLDTGIGGELEEIPLQQGWWKETGTYDFIANFPFIITDDNILGNPAKIKITSDGALSIVVKHIGINVTPLYPYMPTV